MHIHGKKKYKIYSLLIVFISSSSALNIIEWLIPNPLPGLRLGLANMLSLVALICFGPLFTLQVVIGRILLSSFVLGTFLSPMFLISFFSGISSFFTMYIFYRPLGRLSIVGLSILAAITHNLVQLFIVSFVLVRHVALFNILGFLLLSAVLAGLLTGLIARSVASALWQFSERRIFLASTSPRRISMMKTSGLPFIAVAPAVEEDPPNYGEQAIEYAKRQALLKLRSVISKVEAPGCIIASDTVVEVNGEIFGKPESSEEAAKMLNTLSGNKQNVHTAVAIKNLTTKREIVEVETSTLLMKKLNAQEIMLLKDKNMDKAGAYAIQGMKDDYFSWVKGSYSNIVGFPRTLVSCLIKEIFKPAFIKYKN